MKSYVHSRQYLAQFFLQWEMFQTKVVEKSKHTFCVQYGTIRQATDDNKVLGRKGGACTRDNYKKTNTHSEYVILTVFQPARGSTVVKVLCYKSEGRWFDPSWCHWNFSMT